jgi:hypothetical protein
MVLMDIDDVLVTCQLYQRRNCQAVLQGSRLKAYVRRAAHHGRHIQRSPVSETARRDSDGSTTTQAEWSSLAVWRCVGIYTEQKKAVQVDALRFLQVTHCSGTVTVPESSITFDEPGLTSRFVPSWCIPLHRLVQSRHAAYSRCRYTATQTRVSS